MKLFCIAVLLLTLTSCVPEPVPDPPEGGESISILWSMFTTDDVTGYRMYYSYNKNMEDKVWHKGCYEPVQLPSASEQHLTEFSMTCNNFPIDVGKTAYVVLSAITPSGELESNVMPFNMN